MSDGVGESRRRLPQGMMIFLIAIAAWLLASLALILLAGGNLPFDRPAVARLPIVTQVSMPSAGLMEIVVLMLIVWALTRRRAPVDLAARAPGMRRSAIETGTVLGYAMLGQAGGWLLGPALGYRPFSFHIAGTLFGCSIAPAREEVIVWAVYNFLVFALLPWLWFRRQYSREQLNLRSGNPRNDLTVILVVAVIESGVEIVAFPGLLHLNGRQLILGGLTAFAVFFIGTVLPTMILIYAILLPRYLKLTGSYVGTLILGGLTYAAMHLVEGWSLFDTPRHTAMSLLLVMLNYFGPGMFKSFVTLRTGNAWVHALGYHAIAPHVIVDTPLMIKVFTIV